MMFCKSDFQYFKWIKKKYQIISHTLTGIFKSDNRFILKCQNVQYVEKYIFATILNLWWIFMSVLKYVRGSIILEFFFLEVDGSSVYSVRLRSIQSIKSSARCILKRIAEAQRDHPSWSTVRQKRRRERRRPGVQVLSLIPGHFDSTSSTLSYCATGLQLRCIKNLRNLGQTHQFFPWSCTVA